MIWAGAEEDMSDPSETAFSDFLEDVVAGRGGPSFLRDLLSSEPNKYLAVCVVSIVYLEAGLGI